MNIRSSRIESHPAAEAFSYALLSPEAAGKVRASAEQIRDNVRKSIEGVIAIGLNLLKAKAVLGHGLFRKWLCTEFGWSERTAENFMSVAAQFGPKSAIISDLAIQPTAAYLLARPSVPEQARQVAIRRAESGERITVPVAKAIVAEFRGNTSDHEPLTNEEAIRARLEKILDPYARKSPLQRTALAKILRTLADNLEVVPEMAKRS
jgi:hypothetical protein